MKRRDFIKTGVIGAAAVSVTGACSRQPERFNINKISDAGGIKLSFQPYELQLRHVFTVSSYSRKTTPGVQVRLDYEGFTGYGEASMPPYLGQSVESVTAF